MMRSLPRTGIVLPILAETALAVLFVRTFAR
jgi:hypothetical protein